MPTSVRSTRAREWRARSIERERRLVKPVKFLFLPKMGLLNTIKLSNEL